MSVWVLSVDFKRSSLEERTRAILRNDGLEEVQKKCGESIWLVTCNRVLLVGESTIPPEEVRETWAEQTGLLSSQIEIYADRKGVEYLLRVVSSLESMVIGENQITGQFKKAYEESKAQKKVGINLHRLAQGALRASKRVRHETEIGQLAVSVPSVGVKLAERVLGDLSQFSVGILGTGETGRIAAEHFATTAPRHLMLFNRTGSKAEELAQNLKLEGVRASVVPDWKELVRSCDVLVTCAENLSLKKEDFFENRKSDSSLFVLDLSVPAVCERFSDSRILLYGVDDLRRIADENASIRISELEKANQIVQEEVEHLAGSLERPDMHVAFRELAKKMEAVREKELIALKSRIPSVKQEEWEQVEKMSKRLVDKILQDPMSELRNQTSEDETWLHFFRKLFKI